MVTIETQVLRSGALAKAVGLSPDTIRHYERVGVLPRAVRTASGYREYPAGTVERVLVVQRAIRIGFTLSELAEVLSARDSGAAPCRRVYAMAEEKLKHIATEIDALQQTQQFLKKILLGWKRQLRNTGRGQRAYLLDALNDAPKKVGSIRFPRRRRSS